MNSRNTLGTARASGRKALARALTMAAAALALVGTGAAGQTEAENASFEVTGYVMDAESGTRLVGAWVGLDGTDWGSLTDDEGRFRIPDVTPGRLELTVEQLGYSTETWSGVVASGEVPLTLEVAPKPVLLEGLQVVSDRFQSRRNATATTVRAYERDELSTSAAFDALDFIERRAGVWATSCRGRRGDRCLVVRGRTVEPVVYVDEMPLLGGLAYLETFQPWELHMIEVYGGGRHIRAYTPRFMERAAETRLAPISLLF